MSSEWRSVQLGECAELDTGFPFKSAHYVESLDAVRLLRGDNIGQGQLSWDGVKGWLRKDGDALTTFELRENDLVLAMDRPWITAGLKFARVRKSDLPALLVQRVARLRPKSGVDMDYLHYVVASPAFTQHIQNVTTGTAVPHISARQIREYKFHLPDLTTQQAYGKALMSIDDRIFLLRETNTTLAAIAQALFKSWFVDFDPVRAKLDGRVPEGMDEVTAALFPDSFEESALGLAPTGWRVGRVDDLVELAYGKALKASDRTAESVPVYGSGGITGYHNQALVHTPSIIVGRKGTVGSLYWEDRPFFPIDTVFYVKTNKPLSYCFYQLARLGLKDMNTDGAVPGLNRNNVYRLKILLPPDEILAEFDAVTSILRKKMVSNSEQIDALSKLRDTLLPRLISGQLCLPEAETILEEAIA